MMNAVGARGRLRPGNFKQFATILQITREGTQDLNLSGHGIFGAEDGRLDVYEQDEPIGRDNRVGRERVAQTTYLPAICGESRIIERDIAARYISQFDKFIETKARMVVDF